MKIVIFSFLFGLLLYSLASTSFATEFNCMIEPNQIMDLGSPVTGILDHVYVKRGDSIKKMQILAKLESQAETAAAELARFKSEQIGPTRMAESKIEFSKRKFNRRHEMANEKLMSAQDSEDTEAEYRMAESELQISKENRQIAKLELQQQNSLLNLRLIRSPVDGIVIDQGAYPGEVVEPGGNKKSIFKIAQMNPLKVHVILPKSMFGKIQLGMNAAITPEIPINSHYSAKINMIDRLIDAASGTFVVLLVMSNPKLAIPAGVKCKISLPDNK